MRANQIVGIGPSLVDIGAKLPDETYLECCQVVGASPGEWRKIDDAETLDNLMRRVTGKTLGKIAISDHVTDQHGLTISAGSSVLGMLGAMSEISRHSAVYLSTFAVQGKTRDPMSVLFSTTVQNVGIRHQFQEIEGYNPVGFVLSGETIAEKLLCMHPGVANDLSECGLEQICPEMVVVDSYELQGGDISVSIDGTITSDKYKIALSLGNHSILTGELRDKIRGYIEKGKITTLCGNSEEYKALYPELDPELATKASFRDHPVCQNVPYVLMTFGPRGTICSWDGECFEVEAFPIDPSTIVNTSGAGDVSAGVFNEGVLRLNSPLETLRRAAKSASQVLTIAGSNMLNSEKGTNAF